MKLNSPEVKHIHHDTSLSSFATGLFIGTLATLMLATDEGRAAGKKLIDALKETSRDLGPEIEKLPNRLAQTAEAIRTEVNSFDPLTNLHRTPPVSGGTSFHRGGEPLK